MNSQRSQSDTSMTRLGRGCEQCPAESVIGSYYQCQNPRCKNYEPAGSHGVFNKPAVDPKTLPKIIELYGRYSDMNIRDTKFKGKSAKHLIGEHARKLLKGNIKLQYAVCFKGEIICKSSPAPNKPDQVKIIGINSDIIVSYLDWDGLKWNTHTQFDILPY